MDAEHRPFQLYMHMMGSPPNGEEDVLLLQEADGSFWMSIDKSQDLRYLIVSLESPETSEQYVVDLQGLQGHIHISVSKPHLLSRSAVQVGTSTDNTSLGPRHR